MPILDAIGSFINSFTGGNGNGNEREVKNNYIASSTLGTLPSIGDQKYVGYGTGNDAYTEGKTMMWPNKKGVDLLNPNPGDFVPQNIPQGKKPSEAIQHNINNLDQAQAAARANSLVALGFDPSRIQAVPIGNPTDTSGKYSPSSDLIWTNTFNPTATIHESFHRGLEQLRTANMMPPEGEKLLNTASEEMLVRHLMDKNFGPVEEQYNRQLIKDYGGEDDDPNSSTGLKQIQASRKIFSDNANSAGYDAIMNAAQDLYNQRKHKMGPN